MKEGGEGAFMQRLQVQGGGEGGIQHLHPEPAFNLQVEDMWELQMTGVSGSITLGFMRGRR